MKRNVFTPERVRVNADARDYYLIWFTDIPENCDKGYVGAIYNTGNPDLKILIEINDNWMIRNHRSGLSLFIEPVDYISKSGIVVTKETFNNLYNSQESMPGIWHEIGHFHTTKYFMDYVGENQRKIRIEYISRGKIPPAEYVADLFALYYCDRELVFDYFKRLIRERYKLVGKDDNASMAWNELRMRRDALKRLQTDEEIENELCRVCGVSSIEKL